MSQNYSKLKTKLQEIFQLDQADLDFGIYRIMNTKRDEITRYLDNDLKQQVKAILKTLEGDSKGALDEELKKAIEGAKAAGINPDEAPNVKKIREQMQGSVDLDALEKEIFSDLYNFFSRYYEGGDFLSLRRYKEGVYAIPYEGEEVKLHWANSDQYYIKTSEYFTNYSFKLADGKRVHFRLVKAGTEANNNKALEGKDRRFILSSAEDVRIENDELVIPFEYKPDNDKRTQKVINEATVEALRSDKMATGFAPDLFKEIERASGGNWTALEKHLNDYTAKNEFDYFIHKDLGGFMRRELDFFIKNEVLYLDDMIDQKPKDFEKRLAKLKTLKTIGHKIINFLAQLEDFQKKLWLKKKFVVETNWCITLDRVPEELYADIAANDAQREEWVKLFAIDKLDGYGKKLNEQFLKDNPYLVLDTAFFSEEFKTKLLENIEDIDGQTDGLLIQSDNFQALNALYDKYRKQVKHVYIDPPYNTNSTPILYKNSYKHSSWISLIQDRALLSMEFLQRKGVKTVAIDDTEMVHLSMLLEGIAPEHRLTKVTVVHNPKGSITKDFNRVHEYALFLTREDEKECIARTLEENDSPRKMRRWGENSLRTERRPSFYPIYVKDGAVTRIGEVPDDNFHPEGKNITLDSGEVAIWPIDQDGIERRWNFGLDSIHKNLDRITIIENDGQLDLFLTHEQTVPKTVWSGGEYDAGNQGNTLLINILGQKLFDFPKSIKLVEKCVQISTDGCEKPIVLDYFAGSGTTGHAVINLNREDGGTRKYILVEMGEYFDAVTKPRIQKIIYSRKWSNGKPQKLEALLTELKKSVSDKKKELNELKGIEDKAEFEFSKQMIEGKIGNIQRQILEIQGLVDEGINQFGGSSQCFKYIRLESYEDTLNNLTLERSNDTQGILDANEKIKEQYLLHYMLNTESKGSVLNLDAFAKPFDYQLMINRNDDMRPRKVDLVETFNYLIGLYVERMRFIGDVYVVSGKTREGEAILILWRDAQDMDAPKLDKWFEDNRKTLKPSEYSTIYVNGDNTLQGLAGKGDNWTVKLTEEAFHRLMFNEASL